MVKGEHLTLWPTFLTIYATVCDPHGISGNKVNARKRHFVTRSHANGMTRLPCRYAHKNN